MLRDERPLVDHYRWAVANPDPPLRFNSRFNLNPVVLPAPMSRAAGSIRPPVAANAAAIARSFSARVARRS